MYQYEPSQVHYEEAYRQATHRVKAKVNFYWHLTSYLVINGMLVVIYMLTSLPVGGLYYPWFVWPMLVWGVGLAFHFLSVFVFGSVTSPANRQRMIEAEMRRMSQGR